MSTIYFKNENSYIIKQNYKFKNQETKRILVTGVSASICGIFTEFLYFPLDTLKSRIQASTKNLNYVKDTKNLSKYRGITIYLMGGPPLFMNFFIIYEQSKLKLSTYDIQQSMNHLLSSTTAVTLNSIIRSPLEVIKQQIQVGKSKGIFSTAINVHKLFGIKGFYCGYFAQIFRDIPNISIQFTLYEYLKQINLNHSIYDNAINGFIATSFAAGITNPLDVVKSKLMTQSQKKYNNTIDCIRQIYLEEGYYGFLRGIHIRTLMAGYIGLIFFAIFEETKSRLMKIF